MKRQLLRTLIVALLFFGAILLGLGSQDQALPAGQPAPALSWSQLDGTAQHLAALRGRPVVLNFWTTWCPPCREEMPALVAVAQRFEPRGVVLLAANLDDAAEQGEAVAGFLRGLPALAPYVGLAAPQAAEAFQVDVFPTTYVLDPRGGIAWAHVGAVTPEQLSEVLERVLAAP